MIRVLCACDYFDSQAVGGAEIVAREVYGRLASGGQVRATVVGAVPTVSRVRVNQAENLRVVSVPGRDLTGVLGAQLMYSRGLAEVTDRELRALDPDVVHVNGLHFQSAAVGVRLARRHGLPLVATAHLADVRAMRGIARLGAMAFDRGFAGKVARAADQVVAVSESVADHMVALGVKPSRIVVARNGVDRARFHPSNRATGTPWLSAVLVGRMVQNKGTLLALDAVADARRSGHDIRLTIVGDGPLEAKARKRAEAPDLVGAVHFAGRVTDVERWLRKADVSLRPSFTEGLPLAVLESLACGTPVVCSEVPGTLEAVSDGRNGMAVPIGDVDAMAQALIHLHEDRHMLERMSIEAAQTAARFSWDDSSATHLTAFLDVIRNHADQSTPARES